MPETTAKHSKKYTWTLLVGLLVLVLAVFGLRSLLRDEVPIRVAKPSDGDLISMVSTNGKVEPVQNFEAHAPAPGVITQTPVHEGESVAAGTLLVSLDPSAAQSRVAAANSALATAQASSSDLHNGGSQDERITLSSDLQRAQQQLAQAQQSVAALEQLQAKGAASAAEVQAARSRVTNAQNSVAMLNARRSDRYSSTDLNRASAQMVEGRAALTDARNVLAQSTVRAPFAGTVYSLPVRRYDFINAGDVMVRMADLSRMQVRAYFDEPEIGKLVVGQKVAITWEAKPGRNWHGHVVQTPTTVTTYGTRNVGECMIAVDDANGDLLPNTNVNVRVTTDERHNVLSIPREGLRTQGTEDYVYRVVNGRLVHTPVKVGALNNTLVQIVSGVTANDTIALNATTTADLENGLSVKPVK